MWKPKRLSDESIKPPPTSNNSICPGINYIDNAKIRVKVDGSCLKQENMTFTHKKVFNIYLFKKWLIVY